MKQNELIQDIIISYREKDTLKLFGIYNDYIKELPHYPKDTYDERRVIMTFARYMLEGLRNDD